MTDPANEKEQRKAEAALDAALIAFELSILAIIAERLGNVEKLTTAELYATIPEDMARIRETIASGIKNLQSTTNKLMRDMALANDQWAAKYYAAKSIEAESTFTNAILNKLLTRKMKIADEYISAACRSSVINIAKEVFEPSGKNKVLEYKPIEQAYQAIVTNASTHMAAGNITGQKAVQRAVSALANSGLRVQYQSGVTRNLHTAVRTNIMDAYRSTMSEMREIHGRQFGADGVEVSAHALCAPDHLPFQGQRYPYQPRPDYRYTWDEVQNMPDRPLVTGANCGHFIFPILIGITSPAYSRSEINEMNRLSREEVEFEGLSGETLKMSRYEASQYQRKLESNIREKKKLAYLQEASKVDPSAANKAVRYYQKEYKRISELVGLTRRMENTRIYLPK